MANITANFTKQINDTTGTLDNKIAGVSSSLSQEVQITADRTKQETLDSFQKEKHVLTKRQDELDERLTLEPQIMEIRGFMKIGTAYGEFACFWFVSVSLSRLFWF